MKGPGLLCPVGLGQELTVSSRNCSPPPGPDDSSGMTTRRRPPAGDGRGARKADPSRVACAGKTLSGLQGGGTGSCSPGGQQAQGSELIPRESLQVRRLMTAGARHATF